MIGQKTSVPPFSPEGEIEAQKGAGSGARAQQELLAEPEFPPSHTGSQ